MCGRYSLVFIDDLGNRFRVFNPMIGARSRFNIAPGNEMPVIIHEEKNELVMMKWGLVPHWTQDITHGTTTDQCTGRNLIRKILL